MQKGIEVIMLRFSDLLFEVLAKLYKPDDNDLDDVGLLRASEKANSLFHKFLIVYRNLRDLSI